MSWGKLLWYPETCMVKRQALLTIFLHMYILTYPSGAKYSQKYFMKKIENPKITKSKSRNICKQMVSLVSSDRQTLLLWCECLHIFSVVIFRGLQTFPRLSLAYQKISFNLQHVLQNAGQEKKKILLKLKPIMFLQHITIMNI